MYRKKIAIATFVLFVFSSLSIFGTQHLAKSVFEQHVYAQNLSNRPDTFGPYPTKNVHFPSKDQNVSLRGWLVPSKKSKKIVIFTHGVNSNRSFSHSIFFSNILYDKGISSLLFDFRSAGTSEKRETLLGNGEKQDLLGAIAYAKKMGYTDIAIVGFSFGAAVALSLPEDPAVKVIVAHSSFTTLKDEFNNLREKALTNKNVIDEMSYYLSIPTSTVTSFLLKQIVDISPSLLSFFNVDLNEIKPIDNLKNLKHTKILFLHNEKDLVTDVSNSKKLYDASIKKNTDLWIFPVEGHIFMDRPLNPKADYEMLRLEYYYYTVHYIIANLN